MKKFIKELITIPARLQNRRGATMIEYALMVSLISIAAVLSLTLLKTSISSVYSTVGSAIGN